MEHITFGLGEARFVFLNSTMFIKKKINCWKWCACGGNEMFMLKADSLVIFFGILLNGLYFRISCLVVMSLITRLTWFWHNIDCVCYYVLSVYFGFQSVMCFMSYLDCGILPRLIELQGWVELILEGLLVAPTFRRVEDMGWVVIVSLIHLV